MIADQDFDAIVVGSGPGGSTVAEVLTAAGWSVLIFEKGRNHLIDLADPTRLLTDYSNDELKFISRHFLGPDPWLEPRTFRAGEDRGDREHIGEANNLPSTVGGGGVHADGKLPRFLAADFRMRSDLGPVDGAAVEDWPVDYDEMEPFYADAERIVGVAGDADANPFAAWRSGPYPMPPGAPMYGAVRSTASAEKLGLHPYPGPTGANSVPYDGRPACNNCGFCAYYGCPIHAKGDPVAPLQRALLTGRCELRPETFVSRVLVTNGRATGVEYVDRDGVTRTETATRAVVLAGGAVETPRLLLLSGFEHPLIGRHLMCHFQTMVMGIMLFRTHPHRGRAVTHMHDDHLIGDDASRAAAAAAGLPWLRGGMVEHCGPGAPVMESRTYPWGRRHKEMMRESPMRDHMWGFTMQGEDLPQPTNRIDLDPTVRDIRGFPAMRMTYRSHAMELAASRHYAPTLAAVLEDMGATQTMVATSPVPDGPYGGYLSPIPNSKHVVGTVRMGTDPSTSVLDPWGRFHDVPNLMVADSSGFVTSTGYGPTLTIVALAIRNARALASS
ncbi:MAG: Choline dehydrogenase-like flavoprotein [Acidimicrobiales bacterium]|nr:Choline dehydrogenase-like flavoprotein [Acidimicrobiales bacterium]